MLPSAHSCEKKNKQNKTIRGSFEGLDKNCKNYKHQNVCKFFFMIAPFRLESLNNKLSDMNIVWNPDFSNPRFPEPPDISNRQILFPLNLLHSSSIIPPPISRTRDFSKLPITRTSVWLPWDKCFQTT